MKTSHWCQLPLYEGPIVAAVITATIHCLLSWLGTVFSTWHALPHLMLLQAWEIGRTTPFFFLLRTIKLKLNASRAQRLHFSELNFLPGESISHLLSWVRRGKGKPLHHSLVLTVPPSILEPPILEETDGDSSYCSSDGCTGWPNGWTLPHPAQWSSPRHDQRTRALWTVCPISTKYEAKRTLNP